MDLTTIAEKRNKRKSNGHELMTMVFGKVPPQARNLEMAILGSMMIEPNCVSKVREVLLPKDFYVESHQKVCKTIFDISNNGKPDMLLVVEELKRKEELDLVGGAFAIVQLTNAVVATANLEAYCRIVKQKSIMRRLISFSQVIVSGAYEDSTDVFDLLDEAEAELKGINFEIEETKVTQLSSVAIEIIKDFDNKVYNAKNNIQDKNSIYTGFGEWDKINGTLFPGLYIIAGRPGMGKGVHMTEMICRMAKTNNIGVINGEMTDKQLLTRIGCNLLNIDNYLFKKGGYYVTEKEQETLHEAMQEAIQLKLHIENSRHVNKHANKIKLWVEKYDVKCVLADFLTLFKVPKELERYYNKTDRVDYCLDVYTQLCRDVKIPIILYVQMNREILGRAGIKEPNLADLKQSGNIEELAYQVSFLHRPEYYDKDAITDEMGESTKGLCYQIIAKHREGELGRIKLRTNLACSQMRDWNDISPFRFNQESIVDTPF